MKNPDQQPEQYSLPPKPANRSRNLTNYVILALVIGLIAIQWPMLKGVFYRATGAEAPEGSIAWRTDFDAAMREAQTSGKPLLVDFTADWCPPCRVMKHDVWPDAQVGQLMAENYVPVLIDVDAPGNAAVSQRYGIRSIPTILVLDAEGKVLSQGSFMSRSQMVKFLRDNAG
jgi:thiol:disulfide interchange protein